MKTEVYQLRLDKDLKQRIGKLAEKKGISVAGLMRMLLLAELEKEGMGKKESNTGEDNKPSRPE
jgi:antitoxin component of RelBE/YafQ-DinJ toxin-antitoxin module